MGELFCALSRKSAFWLRKLRAFPSDACFLDWACAGKARFLGQKALLPDQDALFLTRFAAIVKESSCWVKKRFLHETAEIIAFSPNGGNFAHPEGIPGPSCCTEISVCASRQLTLLRAHARKSAVETPRQFRCLFTATSGSQRFVSIAKGFNQMLGRYSASVLKFGSSGAALVPFCTDALRQLQRQAGLACHNKELHVHTYLTSRLLLQRKCPE